MGCALALAQIGPMQTERPASLNVFIVDDSAAIRARLADLLRAMPNVAIVGEAESAREAIAGILRTQPHSVVLDLNLTGSNGIDVMRAVHPQAPAIVFVVL